MSLCAAVVDGKRVCGDIQAGLVSRERLVEAESRSPRLLLALDL